MGYLPGRGRRNGTLMRLVWKPALGIGAGLAVATATLGLWVAAPPPAALVAHRAAPALVLADRRGAPLRATRAADGSRSGWRPLDAIDPKLLQAFVAVEDRRFWSHAGVDLRALARAARDNVAAGHVVAGGSTIPMQTARLLRRTPRTLPGKARQILWALRLDAHLDKAAILEQYLNRVPLGQGTVGVEAAAALYFGGTARQVSLGQAALLAALASAPSRDNPLVDPARARARRAVVLRRLGALGYAGPEDLARAAAEPLVALDRTTPFRAPHFTTRVLAWTDGAPTGGDVRTSLDLGLQREVEADVRHAVDVLRDRVVAHAAAVVLDNPTGEILAWVGSPDFFADTAGQVDMVVSPRQPGSALKPFLYGLAFDRGYSAASVLPDVARTYHTTLGPYRPRNYDRRFRGPVRAREALGSSYNVPAVELAERLGGGALLRTLHLAGFASLDRTPEFYGLGLALGNGDVTLLELANGYRALASGGVWRPVTWRSGSVNPGAWPRGQPPRDTAIRVMTAASAALVLDILADAAARVPAFGLNTPLDLPFRTAAKTGTSRHFTDNWAVATTERFTVAVWVGNFSGRPMQGVGGITGAGPLLHRVALGVARRYPPGDLLTPEAAGAVPHRICRLSGVVATPDCPALVEWFAPGTEPEQPRGAGAGSAHPEAWVRDPRGVAPGSTHPNSAGEVFRISAPLDGDRYEIPVGVDAQYATIGLRTEGGSGAAVRWFVDGQALRGERWKLQPGLHVIRARTSDGAFDEVGILVR